MIKRDALVNLLIGVAIALLPLFTRITSVDFSRTAKDNLLVLIMGAFSVLLPEKKRDLPLVGWVIAGLALVAMVFNQWNVIAINVMFHVFYISVGIYFSIRFYECADEQTKDFILNGACFGALIQATIIFSSALGFDLYREFIKMLYPQTVTMGDYTYPAGLSVGSLGNSNLAGSYLALTAISFLRGKWIFFLPIVILALIFTNSAMAVGSFVAGAVYLISHGKRFSKRTLYLVATVCMIGLFFTGASGADSGRFDLWREILSRVDMGHFLFGKGPGWFPDAKIVLGETYFSQEHNEFLAFFNMFGIVGIVAVLPLVYRYFTLKNECKIFGAIVFAAFCNSYGHFTLHQSTNVLLILVAICFIAIEGKKYEFDLER